MLNCGGHMAGRLLIVDDIATNRIVLKVRLTEARYRVAQCRTGAEAFRIAHEGDIDLVILPATLPDMEVAALCRRIKADPATSAIPLLMLADPGDSARRLAALRAGVDDLLSPPFSDGRLLARVRSLLRGHEADRELQRRDLTARALGFGEAPAPLTRPGSVALIGTSPEQSLGWKTALRGLTPHRIHLIGWSAAMELDNPQDTPDLFIVAAGSLGQPDGLSLVSELRSRPATRRAAILTVHPRNTEDSQTRALDIGVDGLLEDRFDPQELALRIDRLVTRKRNADRLRDSVEDGLRMAATDPLTGLYNRRYGDHHLASMAQRTMTAGRSMALLMIDIDLFKAINDNHGHAAGDSVLVAVARAIRDNLRAQDLLIRLGGDEFVVALPDIAAADARLAAERLRGLVAELHPRVAAAPPLKVSVSIGLAFGGPAPFGMDHLLAQADAALYQAKSTGRDRVCLAGAGPRVATVPGTSAGPVQGLGAFPGASGGYEAIRSA